MPRLKPQRVAALRELLKSDRLSATEMLARLNIKTFVRDARHSGLPTGAADLIYSETVLAHIPREALAGMFKEFRWLASPAAVMAHSIGLWDLYAGFDSSLSPFNMLQYSPAARRWLDSPLAPQNRLRVSDYRELHGACGFEIVAEENTSGSQAELERIPRCTRSSKSIPSRTCC